MGRFALIAMLSLLPLLGFAQPDTLWSRVIGDDGGNWLSNIIQTQDNGFIIAGARDDSLFDENDDILMLKLDDQGFPYWQKRYDGGGIDVAMDIVNTADGGYLVVGFTSSFHQGGFAAYSLKTDNRGDTLWSWIDDSLTSGSKFYAVEINNNDYYLAGYKSWALGRSFFILNLSEQGDTLWSIQLQREDLAIDEAFDLVALPDGGSVVVGYASDRPYFPDSRRDDAFIVRLSSERDTVWTRRIGEPGDDEAAVSVDITNSNELLIAGTVIHLDEADPQRDFFVLKLSLEGETIWYREYDHAGFDDYCSDAIAQPNGDVIVYGGVRDWIASGIGEQPILLKYSSDGDLLWAQVYEAPRNFAANSGVQLQDGGFLVSGNFDYFPELLPTNIWIMRLDNEATVRPNPNIFVPDNLFISTYPNPFNRATTISFDLTHPGMVKLNVFDVTGRQVATLINDNMTAGQHQVLFDGSGLASGIYFARLEAGGEMMTRKLALVK